MRSRLDHLLAAAMQDLPVPTGLADRLLTRLAEAQATADLQGTSSEMGSQGLDSPISDLPGLNIATTAFPAEMAESRVLPTAPHNQKRYTRRLVIGGGLLAVAAGLMMVVWLGFPKAERLSEQQVLTAAIRAFTIVTDESSQSIAEHPAPPHYSFSPAVVLPRGVRWRHLNGTLFGRAGIVYEMPGRNGLIAALYVVDAGQLEDFASTPAYKPFATAGCCASAWSDGRLLYVLVVQGDPATYRSYLNRPRSPLA